MNLNIPTCKQMLIIFVIFVFGVSIIYYSYKFNTLDFLAYNILQNDMPKLNKTKFVSVCSDTFNSRRTGNMLFVLAALFYTSKLTGRLPIMPVSFPYGWINHIFVYDLPRFPNSFVYDQNLSVIVAETKPGPVFDEQFINNLLNKSLERVTTILICGYFQSYKYVVEVEEELRKYLRFKTDTLKLVNEFMKNETVAASNVSYIGVHVRRTDFMNQYPVVDENYINTSLNYVIESMGPSRPYVAFMCSDDIYWVKKAVKNLNASARYHNLKVAYSVGHDSAFDLCLLSKCNASIISSGTFSWWSGWLANSKIVTYYSLYPSHSFINRFDYYPVTWKGFPV